MGMSYRRAWLLADEINRMFREPSVFTRHGGKSDLCAALLHREGSTWKLVELAVGPTDVAWENWAEKHKAPAELFK